MNRRRHASSVLWFLAACTLVQPALGQSKHEILKLIPDDVQAAIIIPNLKSFSDQLTQMLEGMGRENLLLGSRPIDQLKSVTGLNLAVDDVGSAAIVVFGSDAAEPVLAAVVPVIDSQAFIDGNFTRDEGGNYSLPTSQGGVPVHVKAFDKHVVLSPNADSLAHFSAGENSLERAAKQFGDQFDRVTSSGEAYIFMTEQGSRALGKFALNAQAQFAGNQARSIPALDQMQGGVVVFDFDPLAFVIRSLVRFKPESPLAVIANGKESRATLGDLPSKPFYFAGSADFSAIGGAPAMVAIADSLGWPAFPTWLTGATSVAWAAYPSPLGVSGGLLNDAVLIAQTDDPDGMIAGIKQAITEQLPAEGPLKRTTKWEDQKAVEGIGAASAYEIKVVDMPAEFAQLRMVEQFIIGRSGWRGFVHRGAGNVIMTFSQRPAVLQAAVESSTANGKNPQGLGDMPTVRALRQWLPQHSDVQVYIGVAQLGALVKQAAAALSPEQAAAIPDFDPELPPIASGFDLFPGGMESSTVVPSAVLALMLDHLPRAERGPLDDPREQEFEEP